MHIVFGLFQAENLNPGKWKENLLYVGKVSVCSLTLCTLGNLAYFLLAPDFFQNQHFQNILAGIGIPFGSRSGQLFCCTLSFNNFIDKQTDVMLDYMCRKINHSIFGKFLPMTPRYIKWTILTF